MSRLPPVVHEGKSLDMIAVCVDRLSGWMVVVHLLEEEHTAKEMGLKMIDR